MADAATLAAPAASLVLPEGPYMGEGVSLSRVPGLARYSLRARSAAGLGEVLGRAVPEAIGEVAQGIACLGPDEWYALLPEDVVLPRGEGLPVGVVDISARAVGLCLEGQRAEEVLGAGCPLDLARMTDGAVTRTLFETVEIILWRESATRFHLEVWRSFAPWLWHALVEASR